LRSREEIAAWSAMTPVQQWQVVEAAQQRRARAADIDSNPQIESNRRTAVDVTDRIKQHLSAAPAVLFMKGTPDFPQCGFSAQTAAALKACGAKFHHVNIFEDPELRDALKKHSNWPTYPQLYVNGELVGGCDIAMEMYKSGELKQALESAGAV
jgi:monothiol glutaredoxin